MKLDVMEKWVAALESGEFKQAKGALQVQGKKGKPGFCCLGVLCEVYRKETGKGAWAEKPEDWDKDAEFEPAFRPGAKAKADFTMLPVKVQKWAGMKSNSGEFMLTPQDAKKLKIRNVAIDMVRATLAEENDNGKTFKTIAKIIKEVATKL